MPFCPAGGREAVTPTVGVGPVPGRTGCGPVPGRAGMGPLPVRPLPPGWLAPPMRAGRSLPGAPGRCCSGAGLVVAGEPRRGAKPSRYAALAAALVAAEAGVRAARPWPRVRSGPGASAPAGQLAPPAPGTLSGGESVPLSGRSAATDAQ